MNDRELMLSKAKKARHAMLELPPELHDELVAGLDARTLSLEQAEERARAAGHEIGKSSIGRYYEELRRERRLQDVRSSLEQMIAAVAPVDTDDAVRSVAKLVAGVSAEAIMAAGGDLEAIKAAAASTSAMIHAAADFARSDLARKKLERELVKMVREKQDKAGKAMTEAEAKRYIREQIYGIN